MIALLPLLAATLQGGALSPTDEEYFESKVRPLLAANCYECHSHQATKLKGHLYLDSREGWMKGGDSGPAIVPGDTEHSALVRAIRYTDPELKMPPKTKLAAAEIESLVEWVKRGAPDPRAESASAKPVIDAEAAKFWSFQPRQDAPPPRVKDESWISNDIDRFVLAKLEENGLQPAPRADKRTLIRRATFDLTGLPPTPAEIDAFVADGSPMAYEKLVDRLLASPHYGERWGRFWLDLARYSDSNGLDENLAMANAWRWRDWVVKSLNEDKPYDRFVTEQLAGDLLPEPETEAQLADQLTATGFLVMGPKMLAEQDKEKLVMDVVDEEIDVASKCFLGLTVSCARCHDHKFDPIPTRDYYALAGIFKSTSVLANLDFVSRWRQVELAKPARIAARDAYNKGVQAAEASLAAIEKRSEDATTGAWRRDLAAYLLAGTDLARDSVLVEAESAARTSLIVDRETWGTKDLAIVRTGDGSVLQFAEYDLALPPMTKGNRWILFTRFAAEESRPMRIAVDGVEIAKEALGEITGSWFPDGQRWREIAAFDARPAKSVLRLERKGDVPHIDAFLLLPEQKSDPELGALVPEIVRGFAARLKQAEREKDPVFGVWPEFARLERSTFARDAAELVARLRAQREAKTLDLAPAFASVLDGLPPASLRELAGRYQSAFTVVEDVWDKAHAADPKLEKLADVDLERLRSELHGPRSAFQVTKEVRERHLPDDLRRERDAKQAEIAALKTKAPPPIDVALGAKDGEVVDVPVHVRGSHLNKAPTAEPRGFLSVLAASTPAPVIGAKESGRLQLAQWLTDPQNPLTARVMVNRIWKGHFGLGIVRTPSNFGRRGDPPSHPELLDWLANELVRRKWSLKAMHRLVMLSSAYSMSSTAAAGALERDPENRFLSHQNRRRLEAESVRDAMLATAGTIDLSMGGSLSPTKDGEYATNDQSKDSAQYMTQRRSIYLPVIRNALYDLFSTFDYNDPSMPIDARASTTDANQALLLMNSPLSLEESAAFAKTLLENVALDDSQRVDRAWLRAYGRAPSDAERERALRYIKSIASKIGSTVEGDEKAAREGAWTSLCQVLFASNEFLHVD